MVKRLFLIVSLVALLLAVTTTVAYAADPEPEPEQQGEGGIDKVIGTLGLYAAMMAVLAVGTEVVIDMVRPVFGLQRKTTATEAITKLKEWLPGSMDDVGLSKDAKKRVEEAIGELEKTAEQFGQITAQAQQVMEGELPSLLQELATKSVEEVLSTRWGKIEARLQDAGLDPNQLTAARNLLTQALEALKGKGLSGLLPSLVTNVSGLLPSLGGLLRAVEEERNNTQSPLRKIWRTLRDSPATGGWLGWVLVYLQYFWDWVRGKFSKPPLDSVIEGVNSIENRIDEYRKYLENPRQLEPVKTVEEVAQRILEADTRHQHEEEKRVKWLRILSAVVGIVLAATLSLDSLQLLEPVLSNAANTFHKPVEAEEALKPEDWYTLDDLIYGTDREKSTGDDSQADTESSEEESNGDDSQADGQPSNALRGFLKPLLDLTPGIILSGLGAAAGSGFWHDVLDKLRTTKQVAGMIETAKKALSGEGEGD